MAQNSLKISLALLALGPNGKPHRFDVAATVLLKGRGGVAKKLQCFDHRDMGFARPYISAVLVTFSLLTDSTLLIGCATKSDMRLSTVPENAGRNARAHPAAYGIIDTFNVGKPQQVRPANDFRFYFKDCEATQNDEAFFSKTAYSCAGVR